MADVMKKMGRKGNRGMFRSLISDLTGIGGNNDDLASIVDQNSNLGKKFNPDMGAKQLTKMMGSLPEFMKKN